MLKAHCESEGRDPSEIEITILVRPDAVADREAFLGDMARCAKLGIDVVTISLLAADPAGWVRTVAAPLVARLAELGA